MTKKIRKRKMTSCCLFCGRPWTPGAVRKSKEHPLGEWMKQLEKAHPSKQQTYSSGLVLDEHLQEFVEIRPVITHKKSPLLSLHTREVCEDCNNGWMSSSERAVKPTILQMAEAAKGNLAIALSREHARELAIWAQKTALAYELTSDPPRVGTAAMGMELREGRPLRGSQVWACRHPRDYDISIALAHIDVSATQIPRPGPPDRQVLIVSFVYHYMSFLICISDSLGQTWPPLSPTRWTLVWPAFSMAEFPPMSPVSGTELTELFTHPGRWIPPVQVSGVRKSNLDPEIRYRN